MVRLEHFVSRKLHNDPYAVRHLPFPKQGGHLEHYHHPRPLILDPHLRLSPKCKLIKNASLKAGATPWVISARPHPDAVQVEGQDRTADWESRKEALEKAGAKIILVDVEPSGRRTQSPVASSIYQLMSFVSQLAVLFLPSHQGRPPGDPRRGHPIRHG